MSDILRIGVIGVGRLGFHHARNIRRSEGAVLAAVSDPFPEASERAAKELGVRSHSSHADIISDPNVDALVIATPTRTHYDVLTAAIAGKKPIFCEKPITYTLEEAEKIVDSV